MGRAARQIWFSLLFNVLDNVFARFELFTIVQNILDNRLKSGLFIGEGAFTEGELSEVHFSAVWWALLLEGLLLIFVALSFGGWGFRLGGLLEMNFDAETAAQSCSGD